MLDFPFIKDGENYKKSFLIQPGELVVCSYNIHNLAKSVFEKRLNVKRMQLQVWLKYGTRGAKELERVYFTKEFDY